MSTTNNFDSMTDNQVLSKWLCAECYPRGVFQGFDSGVLSELSSSRIDDTKIEITFGNTSLTALERSVNKSTTYKRDYYNPYGLIVGAPQDAQFLSFWDNLGGDKQTCFGDTTDTYKGEYSNSVNFISTEIYFADLRNDIVVYYKESGNYAYQSNGNNPMGFNLAYGDFNGAVGCMSIHINDAVELPLTMQASGVRQEIITLGNHTPYTENADASGDIHIAASDRSGYCGGVSYDCYAFGNYAVIDKDKPYDCGEGSYTERVSPEAIESFSNSWESKGTLTAVDSFDYDTWSGYFSQWVNNTYQGVADGTFPYPNLIDIDPLPHGSWAVDAEGNYFHSMITRDLKTFNKLNTEDPNVYAKLPGDNIVFYPVGVA